MTSDADSRVILASSIDLLAAAIEHLAETRQVSPGGAPIQPPPQGSPTGQRVAPPGGNGEKTIQQKRGGLIWGQCKDHGVSVTTAAETIGLVGLPADARKWSDSDQQAVLDAMKDWGWLS